MAENETESSVLLNKLGKIDKIEERQAYHAKEIKEIKSVLQSNELDGRLVKVEKKQEFVLEQIKEIHNDIRAIDEKCDKQRSGCMASVAPLSLVSSLKDDLKRMEERLQESYNATKTEARTTLTEVKNEARAALETSARWTRWAFILSMLACIVSSVSVLICANVLLHLPK